MSALKPLIAVLPLVAGAILANPGTTPVVGGPCEDCDVALDGLPHAPPSTVRLVPDNAPGERLRLGGRVTDAQGRPRQGVIVYANQTDHRGVYPADGGKASPGERRHGALRGWAMTDADGRYAFVTIRPGHYPGTRMPQHVHLYVIERGCALYYIDDVVFSDDPHLTPAARRQAVHGRGGSGLVTPSKRDGVWLARRDIVLGKRIPGYPGCSS